MQSLFDPEAPTGSAVISDCGRYRYRLNRSWDRMKATAGFIMLNPSIADATQDDPTIRRCVGFARAWRCGGLCVVNLFAFRATDPADLFAAAEPVGPENDDHIRAVLRQCRPVVAAWGAHGGHLGRDRAVREIIAAVGVSVFCLGRTKAGQPRHPLYVAAATKLDLFG